MISIYYNTKDNFSLYGIQHFIEKTGISFEINKPSISGIVITYDVEAEGNFIIKIKKNEIKSHICGRILLKNEEIPLCEIPYDTGSVQEPVAYFKTADRQYPCLTKHEKGIDIGIDIFKETGYLLSGHLDPIYETLDEKTIKEISSKPLVDIIENLLYTSILKACETFCIPLVQKSYWPDNKSFSVCLTHDVDELKKTYQYFTRSIVSLVNLDIRGLMVQMDSLLDKMRGNEPYWTYDDIIAIENLLHVKSTYFILKESSNPTLLSKDSWSVFGRSRSLSSPEMQTLIQKLKENGDEIGIHGSYLSYNNYQLLLEETLELEKKLNNTIIGIRQHFLRLAIPKTWEYQVKTGLKYDSSLGFRDNIGFKWGTSFPFFPNNINGIIPIVEIPLIIMDNNLGTFENKEQTCLAMAEEVKRYHGVLTLLWHPRIFNEKEFPGYRDIYSNIIHYCQDNGAWITRARDIYEWVSMRNRQTFSCFYKDLMCTIIPSDSSYEYFFTLYLPRGTKGIIRSENADIISEDGICMYIKTYDLNNNNEIVIDFI